MKTINLKLACTILANMEVSKYDDWSLMIFIEMRLKYALILVSV